MSCPWGILLFHQLFTAESKPCVLSYVPYLQNHQTPQADSSTQ